MPTEVVFVDWHDTLSESKFWEHWDVPEHPRRCLYRRIQDLWHSELVRELDPWMRGDRNSEQFVAHVAARLDVDYDVLWPEFVASCRTMRLRTATLPMLLQAVRQSGKRVYIATDNMDSFSRWTAEALGLDRLVDGILNSSTLRCIKGDCRDGRHPFFQGFLDAESLHADRCVLLDDGGNLEAIERGTGIRCARVRSATQLEHELRTLSRRA